MVVGKQFMHFISIRNKLNFNIMKTIKYLFTTLLLSYATVVTAQRFEVNDVYYEIADVTVNSVSVIKNYSNENVGDIVIPETVTYNQIAYRVTSIGEYAFYDCSGLTSIEIPNSVYETDSVLVLRNGLQSTVLCWMP